MSKTIKSPKGPSKRKWTPAEDEQLTSIINWHGAFNWQGIALHLKNRTGKQCRERWVTFLSPDIKKDKWTKEEDEIIKMKHKTLGNKWALIAKVLPGRSSIAIKNRFKSLQRTIEDQEQNEQELTRRFDSLERSTNNNHTDPPSPIPMSLEVPGADISFLLHQTHLSPRTLAQEGFLPMVDRIRLFN